jgi:hypothetical protein
VWRKRQRVRTTDEAKSPSRLDDFRSDIPSNHRIWSCVISFLRFSGVWCERFLEGGGGGGKRHVGVVFATFC